MRPRDRRLSLHERIPAVSSIAPRSNVPRAHHLAACCRHPLVEDQPLPANESALNPARSRDDFRLLSMDLAFPAEPFAP